MHPVIAVLALRYALVDWSDHADGQLVGAAIGIGVSGLLATVLTARAARELIGTGPAQL